MTRGWREARGGARGIPLSRRWLLPLLLVLVPASPERALATVEGSPHDLNAQGYDVVKTSLPEERCNRCHIASSPVQQDFVPRVPPVLAPAYGAASLLCFSCHDGTTIVSPSVDASRSAFHPASHGSDMAGYEGLGSGMESLPILAGNRMECVTCHDPHENNHRPFLRADLQELCLACHSRYAEFGRGKENRTGNHLLGVDAAATPRAQAPLSIEAAFRTPFPTPYPLQQGKASGSWHWDRGGHLTKGDAGAIGCTSCHAVHGGEQAPPLRHLLTIEPVNDVANLFCEGCHAGTRGDGGAAPPHPNPGGTKTARTYHPVDDDQGNGGGRALETREPKEWPMGGDSPRRLICTTCHAPHAASAQTALLRPTTAPGFCEECHLKVPDYHHPVGNPVDTACVPRIPAAAYGTPEGLACAHCHRAHNAGLGQPDESDFVPLLTDSAVSGALCALCHPPEDPTCKKGTASHFIGDPTLSDTYDDRTPPLRRDPWPESGLKGRYGGEKDTEIGCLSCHAFRKGAVTSGDDGKSVGLLARSGNPVEWPEGGESTYLCTGCHSVDPATGQVKGHSHPMMKAEIGKQGMSVALPITATPSGHLNCDSCHRPHGAAVASGRYILETARGQNTDPLAIQPKVDYTQVCHSCHSAGSY
jgi:predicted CXXCH cytochrome family protein